MSHSKTQSKFPYQVQVIDRALAILDIVSAQGPDLALGEISGKLRLNKSTVHRLVMVLERHKLIERNSTHGRYRLGLKLFELGTRAVSQLDLRERARPYLERLVGETGETVHLCVLDRADVLYLDKVEPARSVRMASSVGLRNPAYCTAVGKAMMACLPEPEVEAIARRDGMRAITSNTITSLAALKKELRAVREAGYAMDNEEVEEGVRCVGCAVRNFSGEPVAAISVSGPTFRLTQKKVPALAEAVMAAARAFSQSLGFKEPAKEIAKEKRS